ncbi:sarcoplasmic calcium-binding proteins I, III, and IV-like [Varroa jacobsoni]|uniref:EF-hand domain-containing protein n=1 Tax=Varroa destructor TaxID=109461 RepID=A0A7M7KJU4_VARDE|nr:sarcoplasmic calcium-binding proteins I, III, and IV-like [Varroa destructor]XP_022703310.1 sarcoplasmic calcium-binding proteins I, III, and IV-like [Varroa jacobsoni]
MSEQFRHRHLYMFHNFWDQNKDGILSWDDFNALAEYYTKVQRKGKLEKDVYERWKSILEKWWNELTRDADYNKDTVVEFDEWIRYFKTMGETTKEFKDLPDFLQKYAQLLFMIMDANKDGLFCIKDYKKYLKGLNLSIDHVEEQFDFMLDEVDKANDRAMPLDSFRARMYEYWTKDDTNIKGKFLFGPFETEDLTTLEAKTKKK